MRKNVFSFIGVAAIGAVIAIGLAGCVTGKQSQGARQGSDSGSEPTMLTITGFPAELEGEFAEVSLSNYDGFRDAYGSLYTNPNYFVALGSNPKSGEPITNGELKLTFYRVVIFKMIPITPSSLTIDLVVRGKTDKFPPNSTRCA